MKQKRIISEAVSENEVKALFVIDGRMSVSTTGVVIDGDIATKPHKKIPRLPFKISRVSQDCYIEDCGLESLENFPEEASAIYINGNPIRTLAGGENIVCHSFIASNTELENLEGGPSAVNYSFRNCKEIVSTRGLPTDRIELINLDGCLNLKDISNLTADLGRPFEKASKIEYTPHLPLLKIILMNGKRGYMPFEILNLPAKLKTIEREYKGKGWGNAIELIRALTDQGFKGNSVL